jgi:hypothetical protein
MVEVLRDEHELDVGTGHGLDGRAIRPGIGVAVGVGIPVPVDVRIDVGVHVGVDVRVHVPVDVRIDVRIRVAVGGVVVTGIIPTTREQKPQDENAHWESVTPYRDRMGRPVGEVAPPGGRWRFRTPCFGAARTLNMHFHTLAIIDGAFTDGEDGKLRYHAARPPRDAEVAALPAKVPPRG